MVKMKRHYWLYFIYLLHVILLYRYLHLDFWNDEIYSFKEFSLVPLSKTISDYHSTNNHIFFNIISSCYTSLLGVNSLRQVFETPWLIRLLPLFFSFVTITYCYKLCEEYILEKSGFIACLVLITCIPYHNFALQMRGYGLSIMFLTLLLYNTFKYYHKKKSIQLVIIVLVSFMLFYTITINLLVIISISVVLLLLVLYKWKKSIPYHIEVKIIASLMIGVLIAFLGYIPLFKAVFVENFVESSDAFFPFNIRVINVVLLSFISKQYMVLVVAGGGVFLLLKHRENKLVAILSLGLVISLLPFLLAMLLTIIMHQNVFERVFVNLVVLYAIILGVLITYSLQYVKRYIVALQYGIAVILLLTFYYQKERISTYLLDEKVRGQGLYFNYYQAHFQPKKDLENFIEKEGVNSIILKDAEPHGFNIYLEEYGVPFQRIAETDSIVSILVDKSYISTSQPKQFIKTVNEKYIDIKCTMLDTSVTYNSIVKLEKINK